MVKASFMELEFQLTISRSSRKTKWSDWSTSMTDGTTVKRLRLSMNESEVDTNSSTLTWCKVQTNTKLSSTLGNRGSSQQPTESLTSNNNKSRADKEHFRQHLWHDWTKDHTWHSSLRLSAGCAPLSATQLPTSLPLWHPIRDSMQIDLQASRRQPDEV